MLGKQDYDDIATDQLNTCLHFFLSFDIMLLCAGLVLRRLIHPLKRGDAMGVMDQIDRVLTIISIVLMVYQINQGRRGF